MDYSKQAWDQLKNKSAEEIVRALERDGWVFDGKAGAERVYWHLDGRRVSIHYHAGNRTLGPALLKGLLDYIGWSEKDLRRLKLTK